MDEIIERLTFMLPETLRMIWMMISMKMQHYMLVGQQIVIHVHREHIYKRTEQVVVHVQDEVIVYDERLLLMVVNSEEQHVQIYEVITHEVQHEVRQRQHVI